MTMVQYILKVIGAMLLLLLPGFYLYSPASRSTKLLISVILALVALFQYIDVVNPYIAFCHAPRFNQNVLVILAFYPWDCVQQRFRFIRINHLATKFGFDGNPASYKDMTVEQAQTIERNMAEWEFPRLFQFAWISDFLRTSTNPGVSRALINSGHMIKPNPMIGHDRLQATVHMMSAMVAYKFRSANHCLMVSRINEHHHRYGNWINSDDVLYLIIHFSQSPVKWINKFGYRTLEDYEIHAMWVLWRELACSMGVKYIPETLEQAKEWRRNFEITCRWRDDANVQAGMAMMNEIIYAVPSILKPFARKLIVSILDEDIVYFCQMEKLGPSSTLRSIAHRVFLCCSLIIGNMSFPRLSRYQRAPEAPNKSGTWNFGHTPYDTLPFFQERSFWNLFGYGALLRRIYGVPMPGPEFFSEGIAIERMGALQNTAETQVAVERKVRENAAILEKAPFGYRPAIGFQAGRLLLPVDGPSYGMDMNTFPESTTLIPASTRRFEKEFERRSLGFSKVAFIEKVEDVFAFDEAEANTPKMNGL